MFHVSFQVENHFVQFTLPPFENSNSSAPETSASSVISQTTEPVTPVTTFDMTNQLSTRIQCQTTAAVPVTIMATEEFF